MLRILLVVMTAVIGSPYATAANSASAPHFSTTLEAESRTPAPGKRLAMALVVKPDKGWHIYWKNPGEAGLPPQAVWMLPPGFITGELQHPVPSELIVDGLSSNIHQGRVTLLTDVSVPDALPDGTVIPIRLDLKLAICSKGQCIPEQVKLNLSLSTGDGAPDPDEAGLFQQARSDLPTVIDEPAKYVVNDSALEIFLPLPVSERVASAHVFFDADGIVAPGKQRFTQKGGVLSIIFPGIGIPTGVPLGGVARIEYQDQKGVHGIVKGYRFVARPAPGSPGRGGNS